MREEGTSFSGQADRIQGGTGDGGGGRTATAPAVVVPAVVGRGGVGSFARASSSEER